MLSFIFLVCGYSGYGLAEEPIRHAYLVLGNKTAIIDEQGQVEWSFPEPTRDGFVLPTGNILLAQSGRVIEVTRDHKIVFEYRLDPSNKEVSTAQRLYNGNTMVIEMGGQPRLIEVDRSGAIVHTIKLDPETNNTHMQTRMARQLRNGNYLVPHLLAFALKEYDRSGAVVRTWRTDLEELGGRHAENWPFTAIRLDNGNTLVSLTHGNKIIEIDFEGNVVWRVTNDEVHGLFKDPCGSQRLANGNTVVGSHAANSGIAMVELTPDKKIVWTSDHPSAASVHHFQILTTNGVPEPGQPLR